MKDELFRKFIKEHIDHKYFRIGAEMVSTGYGMNEQDEPRPYATCTHDGAVSKICRAA